MGGRGSGGSRGGGGASKSINAKTENELNYLLNKSYKYDDDAYEFSKRAASEQAIARKYKQAGKKELAEKYTQYAEYFFLKTYTTRKVNFIFTALTAIKDGMFSSCSRPYPLVSS